MWQKQLQMGEHRPLSSEYGKISPVSSRPSPAQARLLSGWSERSLFQEEWWLEAAAGERLETVEVRQGGFAAKLHFVRRKVFGFRQLGMPPLTRTLGPTFRLPAAKRVTRAAHMRRLVGQLLQQLPPHDRFVHVLSPDCETSLAFRMAG